MISNVENARICSLCISDNNFDINNCQEIKELFNKSSERELKSYPVLTDFKTREITQNNSESIESDIIKMDTYFKELISDVEVKIGERKEARKLKLIKYG